MPIEIEFSPHSLLKIEILRSHGVDVSKEIAEDIIRNPDRIDIGYKERLIAQRALIILVFLELFMNQSLRKFML
jgi:hypothetical protein